MNKMSHTAANAKRRQQRVRAKVIGTADRPRLSVFVSNQHVSAQLIDDAAQKTLAAVSTVGQKSVGNNLTEKAVWVGEQIAKQAKSAKIKSVVFDRGAKLYHGRVKALADAARAGGLEF